MKSYIKIIAVIFIFAAFLPLISLAFINKQADKSETAPDKLPETAVTFPEIVEKSSVTETEIAQKEQSEIMTYSGDFETIKLYDIKDKKIRVIPLEEYVEGAVFHEMPYKFEEEALKAQAVAARTYAVRKILENRENPNEDIGGADVSNDFEVYQGYYTEIEAKAFYKDDFEAAKAKISRAVKETEGFIIAYGDEPIVAAFHSMSAGKTEYSANIWQSQLPYLVPVVSNEDTETVPLGSVNIFTAEEVKARLSTELSGINFSVSPDDWIEILERSESGTVLRVRAGDRLISGSEMRSIFSLRSAVFEVLYIAEDNDFHITVKGYGHGVGMSQYGANYMAKNGYLWENIIKHYYTGTEIARINT